MTVRLLRWVEEGEGKGDGKPAMDQATTTHTPAATVPVAPPTPGAPASPAASSPPAPAAPPAREPEVFHPPFWWAKRVCAGAVLLLCAMIGVREFARKTQAGGLQPLWLADGLCFAPPYPFDLIGAGYLVKPQKGGFARIAQIGVGEQFHVEVAIHDDGRSLPVDSLLATVQSHDPAGRRLEKSPSGCYPPHLRVRLHRVTPTPVAGCHIYRSDPLLVWPFPKLALPDPEDTIYGVDRGRIAIRLDGER